MANTKKIDFVYSFRPIYYFSRIYGLMPFTITYNSYTKTHGSKLKCHDILWFIVSITIHLIHILTTTKYTLYLQDSKNISNILVSGDYFLEVFSMYYNIILVGLDMCMRSKLMMYIFEKINVFDEEVSECKICVSNELTNVRQMRSNFCFRSHKMLACHYVLVPRKK